MRKVLACGSLLVGAACSEAGGTHGTASNGTTTSSTTTTTQSGNGGNGGALAGLVVNEISADGDDYVELFNAGDAAVELGGFQIADEDTPGVPKLAEAVLLDDPTTLAPGYYLFVLANVANAATGPQTDCGPGPSPCYQATFGISKDQGDGIYVIDDRGDVVITASYPANAAATGQTFGRYPNGHGSFVPNAPTPGLANLLP